MPRLKARSSRPCAASSFSMEQKRVPEPKAMQEIISPVFPSRRLGNEVAAAPKALSAPSTTAAVVLFRKSRRDQRVFITAPFQSEPSERYLNPNRSTDAIPLLTKVFCFIEGPSTRARSCVWRRRFNRSRATGKFYDVLAGAGRVVDISHGCLGQESMAIGLSGAGGTPRIRRHHGVMMGRMKKKTATEVIAPAIGRMKKIASDPCDMIRLWRSAFSAMSPSTSANTNGARG